MTLTKSIVVIFLLCTSRLLANDTLQTKGNDLLTLAQAFINLTLTSEYFDTLSINRISKILRYEESELGSIKETTLLKSNIYKLSRSFLYFNKAKFLYRTKTDINRATLIVWKNTLDSAIDNFNNADLRAYLLTRNTISEDSAITTKAYDELIGFSKEVCEEMYKKIEALKHIYTPYFNNNIYEDFKRNFYQLKKTEKNPVDSLNYFASIFNLLIRQNTINLLGETYSWSVITSPDYFKLEKEYNLDTPLILISEYLQLNFIIGKNYKKKIPKNERNSLYNSFDQFKFLLENYYKQNQPDTFFAEEINQAAVELLYKKLVKKYPIDVRWWLNPLDVKKPVLLKPVKYFFPEPAPFPSAFTYIYNFQPALKSLKHVDGYLSNILNRAGFGGQLHYYYVQTGFAVMTSLEKINKDGSPFGSDKRWEISLSGNETFSFYEVFKSIFFATESNFRMFAIIVSPRKIATKNSATTIGAMQELLKNSYTSLPKDLNNVILENKTLSAFVYHFLQNDIGEVPMLETKDALPIETHLKQAGLGEILNNR